jgi:HAD superfamily hydrolase (TIGR01549 family)
MALRQARSWKAAIRAVGQTRVFDGIPQLLSSLTKRGIRVAVVTTSVSAYADAVLRHHHIHKDVLVAYHDGPRKPLPDGVLSALTQLQVAVTDAIGIGDHENDCTAYRAAGIQAVGAGWSPAFQTSQWTIIAKAPDEIEGLLK